MYNQVDSVSPEYNHIAYPLMDLGMFIVSTLVNGLLAFRIMDLYKLDITPPPFFFSIWGLIYTLMFVLLIYLTVRKHWTNETHTKMTLASFLNMLWVIITALNFGGGVFFMFLIIVGLALTLAIVWKLIEHDQYDRPAKYIFVINTVSLYLGWVVSAAVLNFSQMLVYGFNTSQGTATAFFWILIVLVDFTCIYLAARDDALVGFIGFIAASLWALLGVVISIMTKP